MNESAVCHLTDSVMKRSAKTDLLDLQFTRGCTAVSQTLIVIITDDSEAAAAAEFSTLHC